MSKKYLFNKKNVVVTGGAGFIGSHLCDALIKDSKVICIDSFLSGKEDNVHHLYKNPNFELVKHDMGCPLDLEMLPDLQKFEVGFQGVQEVYHLASPTAPADYLRYPIETMQASAGGTKTALDWARKYGASLLFVSSAGIYGQAPDPKKPYVQEGYWGFVNPLGEFSAFQEGKRFAESLVTQYRLQYSIDTKIVRLFGAYGPRMAFKDSRLIPSVVRQAISQKDIIIQGDPEQVVSACSARDIVTGLMQVMAASNIDVVNMGNPEKHTLREVGELVKKLTASTATIRFEEPLPHHINEPLPDISKIKERIGWIPLVSLEKGLREMIEHMRASRTTGFAEEVTL